MFFEDGARMSTKSPVVLGPWICHEIQDLMQAIGDLVVWIGKKRLRAVKITAHREDGQSWSYELGRSKD